MNKLVIIASLLLLLGGIGCSEKSAALPDENPLPSTVFAWDAPAYDDGTPVDGVAGYKIYYGTDPGVYTGSITLPADKTQYLISDFSSSVTPTPGIKYYLSVTALDTDDNESAYSNEITKVF